MSHDVRLIDANKLIRWIETNKANTNPLDYNTRATYAECITMVNSMETIDVEPVRHGRWKINAVWTFNAFEPEIIEEKCSLCGRCVQRYRTQLQDNYCPNCGAEMDGDKHDATD